MADVTTDVLVVGGGGAASRAALEASLAGADVILAVKGHYGAVGTRGAGATSSAISELGAIVAAGNPPPPLWPVDPDKDLADILQLGLGLTDRKLATILVEESFQAREELREWGWTFHLWGIRNHGVPIVQALESQIRRREIAVMDYTMVVDLLGQDGACVGAVAINERTGETTVVQAKAVIVCTGGDANLYRFNLNPACTTGDGYAMGYRAGAELMNLEFKQMTLGMAYPTKNMVFDWVFQPRAKFLNSNGEEFLQNYIPDGVTIEEVFKARAMSNMFSTRVPVSTHFDIALVSEVKAGRGSQRGCVYLDLRDPEVDLGPIERQEWWSYRGVNWREDAVEVAFSHHCSNGGFRIDEHAQTTLPGLYAVGECAAGPHGADRSGGHMLAACQVYGKRAGRHAASSAGSAGHPTLGRATLDAGLAAVRELDSAAGTVDPGAVRADLQQKAWEDLLLIRSDESLEGVLDYVRDTRAASMPKLASGSPQEKVAGLELRNLLDVAEVVASVCRERTESRGSHYRTDFPDRNDDWQRCLTARNADGSMVLDSFVIDPEWSFREGDMGDTHWG